MIEGEGDPLDSAKVLNFASLGWFLAMLMLMLVSIVDPELMDWRYPWVGTTGFFLFIVGVNFYWAMERSGLHLKASGHKPIPWDGEFSQYTEVRYEDDDGYAMTEEVEADRTGAILKWPGSHGGGISPYHVKAVPGSQRRFNPEGEEIGLDWKTPIKRYRELERMVISEMDKLQDRKLTVLDGQIVFYDEAEMKKWEKNTKEEHTGEIWKHAFFPQQMRKLRDNGGSKRISPRPGRAGYWSGSDYLNFGDHNRVPLHKLKSEIRELIQRDKPYCKPWSWAMVSETGQTPEDGFIDYRPSDFRVKLEDSRREVNELRDDLEAAGEALSNFASEIRTAGFTPQIVNIPVGDEDKGKRE